MIDFSSFGSGPFAVNNPRFVVVSPDGKYAFVSAWDIPDQNVESRNHFYPEDNPAGSNIGIIADPLTDPQLVAATRSIPASFPQQLAISGDGEYLYATYPTIPLQGGGDGAVFIYDIPAIAAAVTDPRNAPCSTNSASTTYWTAPTRA